MSLEKRKRLIEYEIEQTTDPALLKLLEKELAKVTRLLDEMYARGRWLLSQFDTTSAGRPIKSATALAILSILAINNARAGYALTNVDFLEDYELWGLISSIAHEEAHEGQAQLGLAIGSVMRPKLSDWKKSQPLSPEKPINGGVKRQLKP